jgi:hypothetical protein
LRVIICIVKNAILIKINLVYCQHVINIIILQKNLLSLHNDKRSLFFVVKYLFFHFGPLKQKRTLTKYGLDHLNSIKKMT